MHTLLKYAQTVFDFPASNFAITPALPTGRSRGITASAAAAAAAPSSSAATATREDTHVETLRIETDAQLQREQIAKSLKLSPDPYILTKVGPFPIAPISINSR